MADDTTPLPPLPHGAYNGLYEAAPYGRLDMERYGIQCFAAGLEEAARINVQHMKSPAEMERDDDEAYNTALVEATDAIRARIKP